jgi:hypothetical protein
MERPSTPLPEILPGQQGHMPSRAARRLRLRGRLMRATTDSHRAALLARHASGASTRHQPPRPLRAGSPSGPSPPNAAPPPSLSQWRAELRLPDCGREEVGFPRRVRERAERRRSAARDLGRSTPREFIASPLHRLVRSSRVSRHQSPLLADRCRAWRQASPQRRNRTLLFPRQLRLLLGPAQGKDHR